MIDQQQSSRLAFATWKRVKFGWGSLRLGRSVCSGRVEAVLNDFLDAIGVSPACRFTWLRLVRDDGIPVRVVALDGRLEALVPLAALRPLAEGYLDSSYRRGAVLRSLTGLGELRK